MVTRRAERSSNVEVQRWAALKTERNLAAARSASSQAAGTRTSSSGGINGTSFVGSVANYGVLTGEASSSHSPIAEQPFEEIPLSSEQAALLEKAREAGTSEQQLEMIELQMDISNQQNQIVIDYLQPLIKEDTQLTAQQVRQLHAARAAGASEQQLEVMELHMKLETQLAIDPAQQLVAEGAVFTEQQHALLQQARAAGAPAEELERMMLYMDLENRQTQVAIDMLTPMIDEGTRLTSQQKDELESARDSGADPMQLELMELWMKLENQMASAQG